MRLVKSRENIKRFGDKVNGSFELFGGFFILLNILKVCNDKSVAGVDWRAVLFFTAWGYWNLYYYPSLDQKASFYGGIVIAIANTVWLSLLIWFSYA
jgi:hypothetical protein